MAVIVQQVVGQLELIEGDDLLHPLRPFGWRVRVVVHPAGRGGVGLAGHEPGGAVEGIPGGGGGGRQPQLRAPRPPWLPPAAPGPPNRGERRRTHCGGRNGIGWRGERRAGRGDARPLRGTGRPQLPEEGERQRCDPRAEPWVRV